MLNVVRQSLANISQQGQTVQRLPLAMNNNLARPPPDVIELQCDHLPGPQPQASEQK
jgi:hypothetical protein